jgi:hypothetical protein
VSTAIDCLPFATRDGVVVFDELHPINPIAIVSERIATRIGANVHNFQTQFC